MAIDDLATIDASKENWSIVSKMNRLWLSPSLYESKLPFSMDMILMDDKGCKIHASVRKTLIYRFQSLLSEGRVYQISFFGVGESGRDFRPTSHPFKINFDIHTYVRLVPNKAINLSPYIFVSISNIMFKDLDTSFLIVLNKSLKKMVGSRKELLLNLTKMGTPNGSGFMRHLGSVDATNVVVVVSCVKIKPFNGKTSLQNVYGATKVLFNPLIEEAAPLRTRFLKSHDNAVHVISPLLDSAKKSTPEDDFLKQNDGKTIEQLKDLAQIVNQCFKTRLGHRLGEGTELMGHWSDQ
ncbi:uncharacterized protein LOC130744327 [Lotus japonicus]|uniref:uncharacterized protein LOC130744327 n=1 Tax=Lotus japonicus TaxID=34305 RepID=UPI0025830DA8|nr:uncharacterized protein LOC130744327 [Lotus japonicus]